MSDDLAARYRAYLDCLNARDWDLLNAFVAEDATHNGQRLGVAGYRAMLERDVDEIPDLVFHLDMLMVGAPWVAARLRFDCAPRARFLGLPVNGRRVRFAENVFYRFADGRVAEVLSIVDKAAIEAQLKG